jgi:hypothetical protein
MPTIINNPSGEGSGAGMVVGILVAIIALVLFFVYGLPALRGSDNSGGGANINVQLPAANDGAGGGTQY